ncbi:MAG: hypothetical protein HY296_03070 [Thaumarchaeota archaeon]|nr:hypothetical protein [Nitrososphaerota archaeon]
MQAGAPSRKAAGLFEETRRTLSLLEGFGAACELRALEALRLWMAEGLSQVVPPEGLHQRYMMSGVLEEYHDPKNEIWVLAFPPKAPGEGYQLIRIEVDPKDAEATERAAEEGWRKQEAVGLRLESFVKLKEELKVAIMAGHQDQSLYLTPKELVYRRIGEVIAGAKAWTRRPE